MVQDKAKLTFIAVLSCNRHDHCPYVCVLRNSCRVRSVFEKRSIVICVCYADLNLSLTWKTSERPKGLLEPTYTMDTMIRMANAHDTTIKILAAAITTLIAFDEAITALTARMQAYHLNI